MGVIKKRGITYAGGGGAGGDGIDYSTTEQLTGKKWIDGKDIYQLTIVLKENNVNKFSYSNWEYVQALPANIDWMKMESLFERRSTGYVDTMNGDSCECVPNPSTRNIYFAANQSTDIVLTIQYTYAS
jgi:hypothetical protein